MTDLADVTGHDRFILRQRIRPIVNQYEFSLPDGDGRPGEPICFVEQKRFAFKEDIRFYTDEPKREELMRIKARQRFDPAARYDALQARSAAPPTPPSLRTPSRSPDRSGAGRRAVRP